MKADIARNHVLYVSTVTTHLELVHDSPNAIKPKDVFVTLHIIEKLSITNLTFSARTYRTRYIMRSKLKNLVGSFAGLSVAELHSLECITIRPTQDTIPEFARRD
jgi:hypothetical protein